MSLQYMHHRMGAGITPFVPRFVSPLRYAIHVREPHSVQGYLPSRGGTRGAVRNASGTLINAAPPAPRGRRAPPHARRGQEPI